MGLREDCTHGGPGGLGDAELVALILGTGSGGRSALEIGAALVARHGGLSGLVAAPVVVLAEEGGVGPARAVRLHAALEAGRRSLRPPADLRRPVEGADDAWTHLGPPLRGLADEELHALYLDRRHRPCGHRRLTRGNDAFTVVDPRQVFRPAVALGAHAVVLAHNHPSGDPTPSAQDREVTRRVAAAGRVLGVALIDHLVCAGEKWVSLAERGELSPWETVPVGLASERADRAAARLR